MTDRPAHTEDEIKVNPRDLEEFEDLFEEWRQESANLDALELGGTGDLRTLAKRCRAWARRVGKEGRRGKMTPARVLWLAKQARSGFDTLDLPEAVEGAKSDLDDIIAGLSNTADEAAGVSFVHGVEPRVPIKRLAGDDH